MELCILATRRITCVIGGEDDIELQKTLREEGLFYEQNRDSSKEDNLELELDEKIQDLFIKNIIKIAKRLHKDGVIEDRSGKKVSILIHELEYYDLPMSWTRQANTKDLIIEFEN